MNAIIVVIAVIAVVEDANVEVQIAIVIIIEGMEVK